MKYTYLFVLLTFMLGQCKNKPSSSKPEETAQPEEVKVPEVKPPGVNPDDCLVLATVLSSDESTTSLLIRDVKEVGFSFKQKIGAGDTVSVPTKLDLADSMFVLTYAQGPGGGSYTASKFKEK
ncbi:hypothetical protein [Marinoscillum sp.]|uniref:hypothetical protein n=1 Tax=Marinoscillum sp. TaxID=2024838 RepID=UPI003BA88F3C